MKTPVKDSDAVKNLREARKVLTAAGLRCTYADMLIQQQIYRLTAPRSKAA